MRYPRLPRAALAAAVTLSFAGCARAPNGVAARNEAAKREPTSVPTPREQAPAAPAPAPLDPRTLGWERGQRYTYRLKIATSIAFAGGPTSHDFALTGHVTLFPVTVTPETVTLYASIGDAAVVTRVPGSQGELDRLAAELRRTGAWLTLAGGLATEMRVPPSMSSIAASSYRQIGSALQFARPRSPSERYTAKEYDTTGQYVAEYRLAPDGSVWQKKKQRYLGLLGNTPALAGISIPVIPQVNRSESEIRLSSTGRPERVTMQDEVTVNGAQMPLRSTVAVELESSAEPVAMTRPEAVDALLATARRIGADAPIALDTVAPHGLDQARIGTLDFETIVSRLEQIGRAETAQRADASASAESQQAEEEKVREDSQLFLALSALFRQQPATITQAIEKLRSHSAASEVLLDALASASTSEAHRALATVIGSNALDDKLRARAVTALGRTPKPSQQSVDALKAVVRGDPFNRGALYGLGTHSRHLRDEGKAKEASAIGEFLVSQLKRARGPMSLVTVLRSIANSGYAGALSRVEPYLADQREQVRSAAVRALQSMRDAKVDGILAARLETDESSQVRISAIEAAQVREPSEQLAGALRRAGTQASDPRVRYRAVELMIRWLPQRPDLHSALEQVARQDTEPRVRDRAQKAL